VTLLLLRITVIAHALLALSEPVLAGSYLGGTAGAMSVHEPLGMALALVGVVQLIAAVLYRRSRGPRWPLAVAAGVLVADVLQIVAGYGRQLEVHVPLGVGIVAASVLFALWAVRAR
jgi:uncharacterized membrane protein HdeD (DUF308 family)